MRNIQGAGGQKARSRRELEVFLLATELATRLGQRVPLKIRLSAQGFQGGIYAVIR